MAVWKKKTLTNFEAKRMLVKIFDNGNCVYAQPELNEVKRYCAEQLDKLWDEVKRFDNPHRYYVDLSPKLWKIKNDLLSAYNK